MNKNTIQPVKHPENLAVIIALESETQGLFQKAGIPVHYCGIGKINAAFKTTEVILKTNCKYVLNLGTAGSHRFPTHSVIECSAVIQKDMDISPLGFAKGETPMDKIPGRITLEKKFSHLRSGVCGTGDRFEVGTPEMECELVDMEAYAIAKVCKKLEIPMTAIKYITDGSDPDAHKDWVANLKPASEKLFATYLEFIESFK